MLDLSLKAAVILLCWCFNVKVVCHSNLRKVVKTSLLRNDARALCDDCVALVQHHTKIACS